MPQAQMDFSGRDQDRSSSIRARSRPSPSPKGGYQEELADVVGQHDRPASEVILVTNPEGEGDLAEVGTALLEPRREVLVDAAVDSPVAHELGGVSPLEKVVPFERVVARLEAVLKGGPMSL